MRRALLVAALALAAGALLSEAALRFLLFSDTAARWSLAQALRKPARFGRYSSDELYHVLRYMWLPAKNREQRPAWAPFHDPRVGWTSYLFRPGDYAHVDEAQLAGRRPILLFGDSFSICASTSAEDCFQGLLERSPLARDHALLNYGVPGYGLDQIWLLMGPVLERFADREPIVVVGLLLDDDLDRTILDFRDWPKPRLRVTDGRLVVPPEPVPTAKEYLARGPAMPASLVWTALSSLWRDRSSPGTPAQEAAKQELARSILRAMVADLRARGLPFFFLLFRTLPATEHPEILGWRAALVHEELDALAAPWLEASDGLLRRARDEHRPLADFFDQWTEVTGGGHFLAAGNAAAFEVLLQGLGEHGRPSVPVPAGR